MFHKIKSVTPLENYRLLVHFTEGCCREYNMTPLIQRMPVFAPLRDVPGLFSQVRTDPGGYGVSWNDDIDMDGSELWETVCLCPHLLTVSCPLQMLQNSGGCTRVRSERQSPITNWWRV